MQSILFPLLAALAVMLISLVGVIFTVGELGRWLQRNLTYLATFAAGVFIVVAWHLAEEAVHEGGWLVGVGAILLGAALMESINFFFPAHHHHDVSHDHAHTHIDGRRVLFSDALHNVGDGILLVAAFSADLYIGLAASVGVLLHEFVQEISEFFVLKESGYSNNQALSLNFVVSSTILIGLFFAAFLSSSEIIVGILAGIAAGGFISVLLHDLLPHAVASVRTHGHAYAHVFTLIVGSGLMLSVQAFAPHEHQETYVEVHDKETMDVVTDTIVTVPTFSTPSTAETEPESVFQDTGASTTTSTTSPQIPGTRN